MTTRTLRVVAVAIAGGLLILLSRPVRAEEEPHYPVCPSPAPKTGVSAYINCIPNQDWK